MTRLCFLSHIVICSACAALAYFAWQSGALIMVWQTDASMMTSVIAVLFLVTAGWLGWQAWLADEPPQIDGEDWDSLKSRANADFGHLAALLSPALGMLGTAIGLSLQAKALVNGAASFGALSTALFTTACGIAGFILISVLVFNVEAGVRRAGR